MIRIKYSQDEKELRYYNVFKDKKKKDDKGLDLIVTNKRVILISYTKNKIGFTQEVKEIPLNDVNGILSTCFRLKRMFLQIILIYIFLFLLSTLLVAEDVIVFGMVLLILSSIMFVLLIINQIKNPKGEGEILLPVTSNTSGIELKSSISKKRKIKKMTIYDVVPGGDFNLVQSELGSIIESAKQNLEIGLKEINNPTIVNVNDEEEIPLL